MPPSRTIPNYPRGFLYGSAVQKAPSDYREVKAIPGLYLHEWTRLELKREGSNFVAVIGTCVSTTSKDCKAAEELLRALSVGETRFFEELSSYSGRYAVIFSSGSDTKFVTDAAGMRSVFYAEDGSLVASHARLIEENLGGPIEKHPWTVGRGYPGNLVPYKRVRILTPNTYYSVETHSVQRFWPFKPVPPKNVEESAREVSVAMATVIQGLASKGPVKSSLTAGHDSRCLLAVAISSGIDFETYTYGSRHNTLVDRLVAAEISHSVGLRHTVPDQIELSRELKNALAHANYTNHHWNNVPSLMEWIDDPSTIVLMETLLEIGRGASAVNFPDAPAPVDAESMALLYLRTMPFKKRQAVEIKGREEYLRFATSAFQSWIDETGGPTPQYLNPYVQFFWEHRMATWHGPTMAERDFYATAVNPSNSLSIYQSMLGVSEKDQRAGSVPTEIIRSVAPALLSFPVNPKKWPPA